MQASGHVVQTQQVKEIGIWLDNSVPSLFERPVEHIFIAGDLNMDHASLQNSQWSEVTKVVHTKI
jgi:hypothetical protein